MGARRWGQDHGGRTQASCCRLALTEGWTQRRVMSNNSRAVRYLLLLLTLSLLVTLVTRWLSSPPHLRQLRAMSRALTSGVGEARLRSWATGLREGWASGPEARGPIELPKSEVPDWLAPLGSPYPLYAVSVYGSQHPRGECVVVGWLSRRGGVGLVVGPEHYAPRDFPPGLRWAKHAPGIFLFSQLPS
jgi:hypothetical protein